MIKSADGSASPHHGEEECSFLIRCIVAKKREKSGQGVGNVTLMCKFKRISFGE